MSPRRAKAVAQLPGKDHAAALREHLIEVAQRLIGTTTISALTTRHIATTAGVSEGVLYNYFGDKSDLIMAGLVRQFELGVARFESQLPVGGEGTIEDNLAALARAAGAMQDELLPIFVWLLNEPELLRRFIDETHREPLMPGGRIVDYLAEERRLGRIAAAVDPNAVTMLLMGAMFMGAVGRHLMPGRAEPAGRVDAIVTTLMHGLQLASADGDSGRQSDSS